jgi:hypothetical protein
VRNVSQARNLQPGRINVYYHEAPGDMKLRRTLRAEAAAYARRSRLRLTLRSHDRQRASRKLSVHGSRLVRIISPTVLPRRYAPAASVQSSNLKLSGCQLLSQGGPGARLRAELRLHDCQRASRKPSLHAVALCTSCPPLYCPGATRGGRCVRYARTIIIKSV